MPDLRNEATAEPLAVNTPTRFEPFAWLPGTPANTNSGTVNADPPPAIVLITPAPAPPTTSNNASHHAICARLSVLEQVAQPRVAEDLAHGGHDRLSLCIKFKVRH